MTPNIVLYIYIYFEIARRKNISEEPGGTLFAVRSLIYIDS